MGERKHQVKHSCSTRAKKLKTMGTSSIYGGSPNGGSQINPLIPADFEDYESNDIDDENESNEGVVENEDPANENIEDSIDRNEQDTSEEYSVNWTNAKSFMSKVASGKSNNIGGALSRYVKAHGGAKSASRNSVGGIRTTINLGNFVKNVSEQGLKETLDQYKIDYRDKSTKEILSELINILAPAPNTKDDAIARKSLILTMEILYDLIDNENLDIESIENLDLNIIIPSYMETYIYQKLINDLGSRIENNSKSAADAVRLESEIREYIHSKIEIIFKGKEIENYIFSTKEVLKLYNQCYTVMEDLL